jgi:hypothetical protein
MSRRPLVALTTLSLLVAFAVTRPSAAVAEPAGPAKQAPTSKTPPPAFAVDPALRDKALGAGWRTSSDIAWTTSGDANGLHILAATASSGYAWRTVATLSEPGFDVDQWIGNACVSGSGRRLVAVYAPRTFTNKDDLFGRGGFTAIVDLLSGEVIKLPLMSTLAYYNPGCGAGDQVVVTALHAGLGRTRLVEVDTARATVSAPVTVESQVTSAVPVGGEIVAAANNQLVKVDRAGKMTGFAPTAGVAHALRPDAVGGVVFVEHSGPAARVRRVDSTRRPVTLAEGELTKLSARAAAGGLVYLSGEARNVGALPAGVMRVDAQKDAEFSTRGELVLTRVSYDGNPKLLASDPSAPRGVRIQARSMRTGTALEFTVGASVVPTARTAAGTATHPKLGRTAMPGTGATTGPAVTPSTAAVATATAGDPTNPVEAKTERYCSVPRNDPRNQALQPRPRQVEWAIDQAITGTPYAARPANWMNLGMPAYSPLGLFPRVDLVGGGRVPAQIYLGIVAQESNMWQAARFAVPGVTANPLIGNYYGLDIYNNTELDDWDIRWDKADCGYGVGQVTDGMRLPGKEKPNEVAYPEQTQRAIALDFAANVAAGLQILQRKWNETRSAGLQVNDGDPANIENWFYAVWAYNSGFHPLSEASQNNGAWGVGWGNNPVNPNYDPERLAFLAYTYDDARHPQDWPYQEKVIGFAAFPPDLPDGVDTLVTAYRPAWWGGSDPPQNRLNAKPPRLLFCDATNNCAPGGLFPPQAPEVLGEPKGPCYHKNTSDQYDLKCWYNRSVAWKACGAGECGYELLRFDPGWAYQPDAVSYLPRCDRNGLPANALIVDDIANGIPSVRPNCTRPTSNGTFALNFSSGSPGLYPSKIDFHQIGGGFGGHFWFAHTRLIGQDGGRMRVMGTWSLDRSLNQWVRYLVHIPDHGAHTRQATYELNLGSGWVKKRVVQQRTQENRWVSLGAFPVNGVPRIRLATSTLDGTGNEDIAWDAVAFQPLPARPRHQIVALGDSFSSGEGASSPGGVDYYKETDTKQLVYLNGSQTPDVRYQNACHRSRYAWSRMAVLSDDPQGRDIGTRADIWDPTMDYHLKACSGARARNVLPYNTVPAGQPRPVDGAGRTGENEYGELPQLDEGYLDEYTTLVTLSIGGNDARFVDVLKSCFAILQCQDKVLSGDTNVLAVAEPARINGEVRASIVSVLKEVNRKAPNAKIMLMGYPRLFEDTLDADLLVGRDDRIWLQAMADLMASSMQNAVDQARAAMPNAQIVFANPIAEFWGGYGVGGAHESINRLVPQLTPGEANGWVPDWLPETWNTVGLSQQTFHPTVSGCILYARVMRQVLYDTWGL